MWFWKLLISYQLKCLSERIRSEEDAEERSRTNVAARCLRIQAAVWMTWFDGPKWNRHREAALREWVALRPAHKAALKLAIDVRKDITHAFASRRWS